MARIAGCQYGDSEASSSMCAGGMYYWILRYAQNDRND